MPESRCRLLRVAACGAGFAVSLACGRNPRPEGANASAPAGQPSAAGEPAPAAAEGIVYVAGSEPVTTLMLRPDTGSSLGLHGDLNGELGRLAGSRVEVQGAPDTQGPGKGIAVSTYTILAIDGRRPLVGVLALANGALWLVGRDTLSLADPDGRLTRLVGAKMWVLPDTSTSPAAVQSYGVLRERDR